MPLKRVAIGIVVALIVAVVVAEGLATVWFIAQDTGRSFWYTLGFELGVLVRSLFTTSDGLIILALFTLAAVLYRRRC